MTKNITSKSSKSKIVTVTQSTRNLSWAAQFHIASEHKALGNMRIASGKFQYLADWAKKYDPALNPVAAILTSKETRNLWENRQALCASLAWECALNSRDGMVG